MVPEPATVQAPKAFYVNPSLSHASLCGTSLLLACLPTVNACLNESSANPPSSRRSMPMLLSLLSKVGAEPSADVARKLHCPKELSAKAAPLAVEARRICHLRHHLPKDHQILLIGPTSTLEVWFEFSVPIRLELLG